MVKGGRHGKIWDKQLQEFNWLQTRGTKGDLLLISKDLTILNWFENFTPI